MIMSSDMVTDRSLFQNISWHFEDCPDKMANAWEVTGARYLLNKGLFIIYRPNCMITSQKLCYHTPMSFGARKDTCPVYTQDLLLAVKHLTIVTEDRNNALF
jgi:hypothetical protein